LQPPANAEFGGRQAVFRVRERIAPRAVHPASLWRGPALLRPAALPFIPVAVISAALTSRWLPGLPRYRRSKQFDSA
jgi:hypothetical protein